MTDLGDYGRSNAALLELRRERKEFAQGHRLLDEKRMLLAQETLAQLERHRQLSTRLDQATRRAREALSLAIEVYGLEDLQLSPSGPPTESGIDPTSRSLLGVRLFEPRPQRAERDEVEQPDRVSPRQLVADRFRSCLEVGIELAWADTNLERLIREYVRTERRARALEDVLLPEMIAAESAIESSLDDVERDEAAALRWFAGRRTK
jgi:V/A-type H+-transporting ATPase subunit D